ncbi:hypothetical protein HED55_10495 [Ochrobactrum haematophilum]|uniref:Uncharacterized protein n=1 Tax=Brucella haematophila TaxID=419474 RepID=A0ABX1DLD0_9HYPH|nr:hypothetical protein [Brucella haematophila]
MIAPGIAGSAGSGQKGVGGYAIRMEGGQSTLELHAGSDIQGMFSPTNW